MKPVCSVPFGRWHKQRTKMIVSQRLVDSEIISCQPTSCPLSQDVSKTSNQVKIFHLNFILYTTRQLYTPPKCATSLRDMSRPLNTTPKRVTSLRDLSPRHCTGNTSSFPKECCSGSAQLAALYPI